VILQGEDRSRDAVACIHQANSLAQEFDICNKYSAPSSVA
jgi:hypothetical protein